MPTPEQKKDDQTSAPARLYAAVESVAFHFAQSRLLSARDQDLAVVLSVPDDGPVNALLGFLPEAKRKRVGEAVERFRRSKIAPASIESILSLLIAHVTEERPRKPSKAYLKPPSAE